MKENNTKNEKLETALRYQALGLSIIPAGPNKVPLIEWRKYQSERATEKQIREWWSIWEDANPAIVTGEISGVVVLDFDIKHNRKSSDFEFPIPVTGYAKSGSGGEHFYFKHPRIKVTNSSAVFGLGVDVRGDGGIVLAPPSVNDKGGIYEWTVPLEDSLADMPEWLLQKTTQREKKPLTLVSGVPEGSRNDSTASLAGKFLKYLPVDEWEIFCLPMLQAWNKTNTPPLSPDEVRRTFDSIKALEFKNRGNEPVQSVALGGAVSLENLLSAKFPDARFVVDNLFESGTINMISAPPNKWKSWIVILCAICVSSGRSLFGVFKTERQAVMIVNEEDTERLLQERCSMLIDEPESLPIYFHIGKQIKLNEAFVDKLIAESKQKNIGFIIFDSLRSVHDADENSSKEMQMIMDQLKKITREGITVLFTHHNRKKSRFGGKDESGEDSRGSSAINGAVHGHISCEEDERSDGKYLVISQPKLKATEKLKPFELKIEHSRENNKMRFPYVGDFNAKENINSKSKEKIKNVILESSEWLSLKDLVAMEVVGPTTIKSALGILESEMVIKSKNRKEAVRLCLPVRSKNGAHNEKLYFRFTEDGYQEVQETIDWTDPPW